MGVEAEVRGEGDVVGESEVGVEGDLVGEAKQGCEAQMGREAQLGVEAEVGVQGDLVGEVELGSEAQVGGDEDGDGQPDVIVKDVSDKDEGFFVDKLDDSEEKGWQMMMMMDLGWTLSHLLEILGLFWIGGKQ